MTDNQEWNEAGPGDLKVALQKERKKNQVLSEKLSLVREHLQEALDIIDGKP